MTLRTQLTTAALLGTAQQAFQPSTSGTPLHELLPRLRDGDGAQRFLDAAALIVNYERAGAMPVQTPPALAPADHDPRPLCTPVAAEHLAGTMSNYREQLPEWLRLAASAGVRPPEELVVGLLQLATSDVSIREAVISAAGPLAAWLAQFLDNWSWITAASLDESIWETGSADQRLAFFTQIRRSAPARSRELLQACWQAEPLETKRRFVEAFSAGLSLDDEPFLESVLDDRSVVVRRAAAEHLASLSGSQLIERMKTRLDGRIRMIRSGLLGRKNVLEVEPVEAVDDAMLRDGIDKKAPAAAGMGDRAWWTGETIAAIQPSFWCDRFQLSPPELIEAARNGQWQEVLLMGWRRASVRHRAAGWLEALAGADPEPRDFTESLFRAMPPAARERVMVRLLKQNSEMWFLPAIKCCTHDWSVSFTEEFVEISELMAKRYAIVGELRMASRYASPRARWPEESEIFAVFTDIVGFRRRMHDALNSART